MGYTIMRISLRGLLLGTFLLLLLPLSGATQSAGSRSTGALDELLNGPDRQDLPWKVTVLPPRLMYQQRFLVQMRARISANLVSAANTQRTLHFVLKVKTADGQWLKEGEYNDYPVPADLGNRKDIEYATGVYLRPGDYTLALIAIDGKSGKVNVVHRAMHVDPVKDDPFPEIDGLIPVVEFPAGFPEQEVAAEEISDGELFPMAHQADWVQIDNKEPIQVDIVLNVTKRMEVPRAEPLHMDRMERIDARMRAMMAKRNQPTYHLDVGRMLQVGNVLAHLRLNSGCIRVSAIDVLRMKTIVDRASEKTLDWDKFEDRIEKFDQNTVDAAVLANKKGPAQFLHKYLETLSADSSACGNSTRHYIIVVSHEVPLPGGAREEKLDPVSGERARFFYLHGGANGMGDDVSEVMKPVKPERLMFTPPREFRKSFGRLVTDLRSGK
jgi:hypothetical protein